MGLIKTPQRLYAEKLVKERQDLNPTEIAKLVYKKFPKETKSVEGARTTVRIAIGRHGVAHRKDTILKELFRPTTFKIKEPKQYKDAAKRKLHKSQYYLITWAQNNTPIHKEFWANIQAYSKFLGAEIHVVLGRYKNPNSLNGINEEEFWDKEILPYADAHRHHLHKYLELLSDIKVQPTATNILSDLEGMSGINSCIIGSPKVQFKVIPSLEGYKPKMMFSTGSVTKCNYTDSKAGKKGEFHHTFGFTIVEIKDKDTFFIRQVTALKNGSFTDLCHNVKDNKVSKIQSIDIAILGDSHRGDHCEIIEQQQRKWLDIFKPKYTILHDVFNGHSISHHEEKDPIKQFQREQDNSNNLKKEIDELLIWINSMLKYNLVLASANHNDWLDRYIRSNDWKKNIKNALTYIQCANILLEGKAKKGLIAYFIDGKFGKKVKTLGRDESFKFNEWELAQHGDIGTNGSRGNVNQYRKLSTKMILGHSHTPIRMDGVIYVGTSTKLRVGYNTGASSWLNCDVIIHKDNKAQHIIYLGKDKNFTTFKL